MILFASIVLGMIGSIGTLNNSDSETKIKQANDNLDAVLQREIRLLTSPLTERVNELVETKTEMRAQINDLNDQVAENTAYIDRLQQDVERLKGK